MLRLCLNMRSILATVLLACSVPLAASEPAASDFLIEEAFQQPNVMKYALGYARSHDGTAIGRFAQEWTSRGTRHQISYAIGSAGDVAINYRYQFAAGRRLAIAPGVTAVARAREFQVNVPVSWAANDHVAMHWNVGTCIERGSRAQYAAGQSVVVTAGVDYVVEMLWTSGQRIVNPGVRRAFDIAPGLKIVPAVTMAVTQGSRSVLLSISIERTPRSGV